MTRTEDRYEWEAHLVPHSQLYVTGSQLGRSLWLSQRRSFKTPRGDSGPSAFTLSLPDVRDQWMECHLPHSPWFSTCWLSDPESVIRSPETLAPFSWCEKTARSQVCFGVLPSPDWREEKETDCCASRSTHLCLCLNSTQFVGGGPHVGALYSQGHTLHSYDNKL